jgi:hypothetical protein
VHSSGQLEYLGTSHHPSPAWLNFPEDSGGEPVERHVSPGYVLYQEQDGDEGSTDSEGYHDSPAVFVVSANCSTNCSSSNCCHNLPTTDCMGPRTLQLHPARSCSLCLPACLPSQQGGEPTTVAPADRPSCLRCLNGMHFIGHADCSLFCDDLVAVMLLFYCQDCRIQCCMDHPS